VSVPVPTSATEYYAQNLVHFDNIADAVPDIDSAAPAVSGNALSSPASTLLLKTEPAFQVAIDSSVNRKLPFELQDLMAVKLMAAKLMAGKLEDALDEIAADVCQAEIAADIRPEW
jgi:hypothetical protein